MPSPPTLFLSPAMFFLLRSRRPSLPHPLLQRCRRRWRASCRQCKCGGGQRPIRGGRGAANWTEGSCGFGSTAAPGPTVSGDGGRHEQRLPARLGPRGVKGHDAPAGAPGADGVRPPMTVALLAANVLIYLRPGALHEILPSIARVSFNPQLIIEYHDWTRFFLSPFYHLSESHLFYNMTSLLWKGIQLETSMGSAEFASMVAALLGLSQGISLLLAKGLILFGDDTAYYDQYAVGFSGVLFAMKVVLNAWSDNFVYLHGMVIPAKYAAWAELILIQVFIPGTSFLGHLGGILAGLVYLWLKRTFNGPDPLTLLISSITKVVTWPLKFTQKLLRSVRSQGRITGGGRVGRRASARETGRGLWRCSTCTYDNSIATDICEMCSTAREDLSFSRRQNHQAGGSGGLSVDEVRRRRLQRFDR